MQVPRKVSPGKVHLHGLGTTCGHTNRRVAPCALAGYTGRETGDKKEDKEEECQ